MNKSFLLKAGGALVVGTLAVLVCHWYLEPRDYVPPPSESALSELAAQHHGSPETSAAVALPKLPASQAVRLAIGGLGLSDETRNRDIADLVIAELTDAPGLELVERQALVLALRELSFSLSGLIRARDAIRVGKLVRADWFLLGSPIKLDGTNTIVVRVVDARTGILREAGVFGEREGVTRLSKDLATFVRQCRQNAGDGKGRTYLAIGVFQDLSLNSRQAALPGQLRSYLMGAYQGAEVTLLEREAANTLLQEVRLDLAGLTEEGGTNTPAPMQSAYWMVDGSYQSYETAEFELELALNVRRLFGRSQQFAMREKPGQALFSRVKQSIDGVMARDRANVTPTRLTELRAQLAAGAELARSAGALGGVREHVWIPTQFHLSVSELARRRRNVEEAIRAFETVLLLDPGNREAKMCMAACFRLSYINRIEEARDTYREICESPARDRWTGLAEQALPETFPWVEPQETRRWFENARQQSTSAAATEFYRAQSRHFAEEAILQKSGTPEAELLAEQHLLRDVEHWERQIVREHVFMADFHNTGLGKFVEAFGTNQVRAAQRLVELLPRLQTISSNLAPHLLAGVVTFQVNTNAPVIQQFEQSLAAFSEDSARYFEPGYYVQLLSGPVYRWAEGCGLRQLAAKAKQIRFGRAPGERGLRVDDADRMGLAFNYLQAEAWQKALDIFQSYSNRPVFMGGSGLWGQAFTVVLTSQQAALCREKLGLPPVHDPREFDLGKPCLCLHTPSDDRRFDDGAVLAAVSDGLWIGINDRVMHVGFDLKTNTSTRITADTLAPISVLCAGESNVWIGTKGGGLLELNKATRRIQHFTEKDGLLMDYVSGLHLAGGTLWIGYGNESGGGLGRVDLSTRRFTSFSASLLNESAATKPARHRVSQIQGGPAGDVWFLAHSSLYCYRPAEKTWEEQPNKNGVWVRHYAMDGERLIAGLEIAQEELTIETTPSANGAANPPQRFTRVVSYEESARWREVLRTNRSGQRTSGSSTGGSPPKGALEMRTFRDGQREHLLQSEGLPNPPTALALHGRDVWVGGQGFVALVDLPGNRIKKLAYVPTRSVDDIQVGGGYVWVQFDKHLHRARLSDL